MPLRIRNVVQLVRGLPAILARVHWPTPRINKLRCIPNRLLDAQDASSKYMTLTATAKIGAVMTFEMIDATTVAPLLIGVAMIARPTPIAITISRTTTRVANTDQASPRTKRHLRPKAAIGPARSTTIAGAQPTRTSAGSARG